MSETENLGSLILHQNPGESSRPLSHLDSYVLRTTETNDRTVIGGHNDLLPPKKPISLLFLNDIGTSPEKL